MVSLFVYATPHSFYNTHVNYFLANKIRMVVLSKLGINPDDDISIENGWSQV